MNQDTKTVIVLGMHRSGISVTASVLDALGVNMGDSIDNPSITNVTGHFEDKDFVSVNKQILKRNDGSWNRPPDNLDNNTLRKEIQALLSEKHSSPIWGWKDPRTVLTYELFRPHVKKPHLVFVYRNPLAVAKSLQKREGTSIATNLRLINEYNRTIDAIIEAESSTPHVFINYEQLLSDTSQEIKKLADFLHIDNKSKRIERAKRRVRSKDSIRRKELLLKSKQRIKDVIKILLPDRIMELVKRNKN